jgi:hypothetical protein
MHPSLLIGMIERILLLSDITKVFLTMIAAFTSVILGRS